MNKTFQTHDKRPTILDLWVSHQFDASSLAFQAHVPENTIDAMITSQPVQREDAEKVLAYLSTRYQRDYTLKTVYVVLHMPIANKSEVARIMQEIDTEYESAMRGMQGLAQGTARHEFITKRMENMAKHLIELGKNLGDDAVMQAMIEWQDREASTQKELRS